MIYFAQPTNGGPIRIGASNDYVDRKRTLGTWLPGGIEMVLHLKGGFLGEAILLQCFDPIRVERDWFKSCAPIWRFIIDASNEHPLWLPRDEGASPKFTPEEIVKEFGSAKNAAAELGYKSVITFDAAVKSQQIISGCGFASRVMFNRLLKSGALPEYIANLHPTTAAQQGEVA